MDKVTNLLTDLLNLFQQLLSFLDNHTGFLTVIGWIVITTLGIWAAKIQLRNSARLEMFRNIYKLKQAVDEKASTLGLNLYSLRLPFHYMHMAESETEELRKFVNNKTPGEIWIDHARNLSEEKFQFDEAYLQFWNYLTIWNAELFKLSYAKDILFTELSRLSGEISDHAQYLMSRPSNNYRWREWDKREIEKRCDALRDDFDQVNSYLNDYMDLVHRELIYPIFGRKRIPREEFNYKKDIVSKTLTKTGIKEIKYGPTRIATLKY